MLPWNSSTNFCLKERIVVVSMLMGVVKVNKRSASTIMRKMIRTIGITRAKNMRLLNRICRIRCKRHAKKSLLPRKSGVNTNLRSQSIEFRAVSWSTKLASLSRCAAKNSWRRFWQMTNIAQIRPTSTKTSKRHLFCLGRSILEWNGGKLTCQQAVCLFCAPFYLQFDNGRRGVFEAWKGTQFERGREIHLTNYASDAVEQRSLLAGIYLLGKTSEKGQCAIVDHQLETSCIYSFPLGK